MTNKKVTKNTRKRREINPSFSSPTSAVSVEETRILNEHINQQNMFKIIDLYEPHRKTLTLKKFFKMKRNQQVVITPFVREKGKPTIEGKVAAIGRDFVMITNLQKRMWLPYAAIQSATIPFGTPTYSNPHQHHIYDNQLRKRLVLAFGETVSKRDALIQQFFEESLQTSLATWEDTWVHVKTANKTEIGRIWGADRHTLTLKQPKSESSILLNEIHHVSTLRFLTLWKEMLKSIF